MAAATTSATEVRRRSGSNDERFLGMSTIGYDYDHDHDHDREHDLSDLIEEDMWSSIDDSVGYDTDENSVPDGVGERHGGTPTPSWHAGHTPRTGGLSLAFQEPGHSPTRILHQLRTVENGHHHRRHGRHGACSAPLSVPNWSKLRVDAAELLRSPNSVEASGDGDDEWLPPHEYLARASAVSGGTVGASVLEGAGRTLKGRDLSRVRDAVWWQTGFFG